MCIIIVSMTAQIVQTKRVFKKDLEHMQSKLKPNAWLVCKYREGQWYIGVAKQEGEWIPWVIFKHPQLSRAKDLFMMWLKGRVNYTNYFKQQYNLQTPDLKPDEFFAW